jgi:hypothetical protein
MPGVYNSYVRVAPWGALKLGSKHKAAAVHMLLY